jgi:hypothetical protein
MLWPRLSPERSCVCCRSRRRLGRLRARPASHCNLDRVVFRYQNERRSRLWRPLLIAQRASTCSESCLSGLFPSARTDQDGPQWVKCGRQIQCVDSGRLLRAISGGSPTVLRTGPVRPFAALPGRSRNAKRAPTADVSVAAIEQHFDSSRRCRRDARKVRSRPERAPRDWYYGRL